MKNRKRNRMLDFDYSQEAIYFLTSCCKNRINFFGEIVNNEMILNKYGEICQQQIEWLQNQYPYIEIHNYIVMPNHVHLLIEINRSISTRRNGNDTKIKSISSLMGAFKTTTSKKIHHLGNEYFAWQRSFYDHIVRNNKRYEYIFNYITDNPKRWKEDTLSPEIKPNFKDDE